MTIKHFFVTIMAAMLFVLAPIQTTYADSSRYTITPQITDAAYDYLTEIYIEKNPEMGLEFTYGGPQEKEVLTTLANTITKDFSTDKEKAMEIAKWVSRNIEYSSMFSGTYYFPIDVFHERSGNCLGYSLLISQLMRLEGIPAVMCAGDRGDMVNVLTVENSFDVGHAWVMAYFDGQWHLYDPLFGEYDVTDRDYISKWYSFYDMEGVSPYCENIDLRYICNDSTIFYINGRFMCYAGGMPGSEFYQGNYGGGKNFNMAIFYDAYPKTISTGYSYVDAPSRYDAMLTDEAFTNGWISYDDGILQLQRYNGTTVANTFRYKDGQYYFLDSGGSALALSENPQDYCLTNGRLTLGIGETRKLTPYFAERELSHGRVLSWESLTPDTVEVDQEGNITTLAEGYATVNVVSKEPDNSDTSFFMESIELYVSKTPLRTPDYSDHPIGNDSSEESEESEVPEEPEESEVPEEPEESEGPEVSEGEEFEDPEVSEGEEPDQSNGEELHTHTYKDYITRATFKKEGEVVTKCTCGDVSNVKTLYTIGNISLSKKSYTYNGKSRKPAITVRDGCANVIAKEYYDVRYKNNKVIGKATVTITFKGRYKGTATRTFEIKPAKTTIRSTIAAKKAITVKWKKGAKAQTSGYQIMLATNKKFTKNKKTVTVKGYKAVSKKITGLKPAKKYYIRIRTYKTVNGTKVFSDWSKLQTKKTKKTKK